MNYKVFIIIDCKWLDRLINYVLHIALLNFYYIYLTTCNLLMKLNFVFLNQSI